MDSHCTVLSLPSDCGFIRVETVQAATSQFNFNGADLAQIQISDRACRQCEVIGESGINRSVYAHQLAVITEYVHQNSCA